ncbi:MAG: glutamate--cysteine ligase [Myxococcota bacterium]
MTQPSPAREPEPIRSRAQLLDGFARGERPADRWLIGSEYEKMPVLYPDGVPLSYESEGGRPGIRSLLEELAGCCGWGPEYEADLPIALGGSSASVTLEPGGQFELSGAPVDTIHETVAELRRHESELAHLQDRLPVRWLWVGANPVHRLDQIGWMPKHRYDIMKRYLPTRGRLAHVMMKSTCTVQANLDYGDEADMGRKLRTSMGLSSIVTAMFANSPFVEGRPSGWKSYRAHVWNHTDPDRCGLLRWVFEGDAPTYERYRDYALKVPLFFIVRDGRYLDCAGLPFEDFLRDGFQGHRATLDDWELHLTTLFPEVRLKTYMEMRSADCVKPPYLPALPAIWKGVLYDEAAREAAWDLVKSWSFAERQQHRADAARYALQASVPRARYLTTDLARELLDIARHGLARQAETYGHEDESVYLEPLCVQVDQGRCPADDSLEWYARTHPTPIEVLSHYQANWIEIPA